MVTVPGVKIRPQTLSPLPATCLVQDSEAPHCQGSGREHGSRPDTGDARCPVPVPRDCRLPTSPSLPPAPPFMSLFLQSLRVAQVRPAGVWMKVLRARDRAETAGVSVPPTPGSTGLDARMRSPLGLSPCACFSNGRCRLQLPGAPRKMVSDRSVPLSAPELGTEPGKVSGVRDRHCHIKTD